MGPNRFSSCTRKRQGYLRSPGNQFEAALLGTDVAPRSLFCRNAPHLPFRREKQATHAVFQALLSEANRELARLLQDVRKASHGALLCDTPSQPINELLVRAVRCATKQYMVQAELGNLALTDELTGLYNRRGFMAIAERHLKVGRRSGRGMLLFFIDLDGLKQINDSFGHIEGDRALKRTAEALEKTFRDSDVIARLGGDEFAVLAIEAEGHSEATIQARLCEHLKLNDAGPSRYAISLSLGAARFDTRRSASIGELIVQADQAMYEHKRRRSKPLVDPIITRNGCHRS
jgi:diguanylate cyclase (GGDEF)-like protein